LKSEFKENYVNKNYFTISYEELYYNDGFQKILDYLNIECLKNENFPVGEKYRVHIDKTKTLI
jgi:phage anti-repressor protein